MQRTARRHRAALLAASIATTLLGAASCTDDAGRTASGLGKSSASSNAAGSGSNVGTAGGAASAVGGGSAGAGGLGVGATGSFGAAGSPAALGTGGSGGGGLLDYCGVPRCCNETDPQSCTTCSPWPDESLGQCPPKVVTGSCWTVETIGVACGIKSLQIDAAGKLHIGCKGQYVHGMNGSYTYETTPSTIGGIAVADDGTVYTCGGWAGFNCSSACQSSLCCLGDNGSLLDKTFGLLYAKTSAGWTIHTEGVLAFYPNAAVPDACTVTTAGTVPHGIFHWLRHEAHIGHAGLGMQFVDGHGGNVANGVWSCASADIAALPNGALFGAWNCSGYEGPGGRPIWPGNDTVRSDLDWDFHVAGGDQVTAVVDGTSYGILYDAGIAGDYQWKNSFGGIKLGVHCPDGWYRWTLGCKATDSERLASNAVMRGGAIVFLTSGPSVPGAPDGNVYLNAVVGTERVVEQLPGVDKPAALGTVTARLYVGPNGKLHMVYNSNNQLVHAVSCQ